MDEKKTSKIRTVRDLKEEKRSSLGLGSIISARFIKTGMDEPLPELHGQSISSIRNIKHFRELQVDVVNPWEKRTNRL